MCIKSININVTRKDRLYETSCIIQCVIYITGPHTPTYINCNFCAINALNGVMKRTQ